MDAPNVGQQQVSQLLHNKFVVVLGDSIQRAVYKDMVLLLQKDRYLSRNELKAKGEMSFEQDCLVEGGCLGQMHNGTQYKEVRQFQSDHHLVRFYFVTRIYSAYMQSIISDFRSGPMPDVVIVNSCVWDISRYNTGWRDDYTENLHKFFVELNEVLPEETLTIWNLSMPLGHRIIGGFLVPETEHKAAHLRYDVIEANFHSGSLADTYGMDVLDLHYHFRFSLQHRIHDGIHWNAIAHRKLSNLLLRHMAKAWGIKMPSPLTQASAPVIRNPLDERHLHNDRVRPRQTSCRPESSRAAWPQHITGPRWPVHHHHHTDYDYLRFNHYGPHVNWAAHHHFVMRSLHHKQHFAPYTHHRPWQHTHHSYCYY